MNRDVYGSVIFLDYSDRNRRARKSLYSVNMGHDCIRHGKFGNNNKWESEVNVKE